MQSLHGSSVLISITFQVVLVSQLRIKLSSYTKSCIINALKYEGSLEKANPSFSCRRVAIHEAVRFPPNIPMYVSCGCEWMQDIYFWTETVGIDCHQCPVAQRYSKQLWTHSICRNVFKATNHILPPKQLRHPIINNCLFNTYGMQPCCFYAPLSLQKNDNQLYKLRQSEVGWQCAMISKVVLSIKNWVTFGPCQKF